MDSSYCKWKPLTVNGLLQPSTVNEHLLLSMDSSYCSLTFLHFIYSSYCSWTPLIVHLLLLLLMDSSFCSWTPLTVHGLLLLFMDSSYCSWTPLTVHWLLLLFMNSFYCSWTPLFTTNKLLCYLFYNFMFHIYVTFLPSLILFHINLIFLFLFLILCMMFLFVHGMYVQLIVLFFSFLVFPHYEPFLH